MRARALVLAVGLFAVCGRAWAYPELVRKGYNNCLACHHSPSGGGLVTEYGRELSREIVSTFGVEGEEKFLYGLAEPPKWLNLGGEIYAVQTYSDTPTLRQGKFILMQLDAEAAAMLGRWTAVAAAGKESPQARDFQGFISRRHYLMYRASDEITVRGGRFFKAFGINTPDHVIVTKRGLGWDEGTETYNLEGAWNDDKVGVFATAVFGRSRTTSQNFEKGISLTGNYFFGNRFQAGGSYFYGYNSVQQRHVAGPYAILGITPELVLMTEIDFQHLEPKTTGSSVTDGMVSYARLSYELFKGFHPYLTHEYSKLNFDNPRVEAQYLGAGLQWFPRPHFEFRFLWQKQKAQAVSPDFTDFAWLLLHYYL